MALDEQALLRHLRSTETSFVERKRVSDTQDFAKTVVSFANTFRPDEEGVLFIGATDEGEIENHSSNFDKIQKSFVEKTKNIYPEPPYYYTIEVRESGRSCLAVVIPGGRLKPYFTGAPYFRLASTSAKATPAQYEQLLATRSDKAYELQQWVGKMITLYRRYHQPGVVNAIRVGNDDRRVESCNRFYLTLSYGDANERIESFALARIDLTYDYQKDRLRIELDAAMV